MTFLAPSTKAHGVDEDVDAAVGADGLPHRVLDGGGVERIGADPERSAATARDLGREPVQRPCSTSTATTVPPSRPMMPAVARPMPAPAAEISATLPSNLIGLSRGPRR